MSGVAVAVAGCGDASGPSAPRTGLLAVNGATRPAVRAGTAVVLEGVGFGSPPDDAAVLVTTAGDVATAEIVSWNDVTIRARLPADAVSGTITVRGRGDSLGSLPIFVRAADAFDPTARQWAAGEALPGPRWGAGAAALHYPDSGTTTTLIVLFGGRGPAFPDAETAGPNLGDSTFIGETDTGGAITAWLPAPDTVVPRKRYLHTMVGADRTNARLDLEAAAYMLGGLDTAGRVLAEVQALGVTSAGEYSFWSPLTPLPAARAGAAGIVTLGNLFVIGGMQPDSQAATTVYVAVITAEGLLNGWFQGPPLPEGRAFASAVEHDGVLYVIGGESGTVVPDSVDSLGLRGSVLAIRLSDRTGFFAEATWTALPDSLLLPRSRHAAFAVGNAIVVTGGVYPGVPSAGESEFATFATDGTLGPFAQTGQSSLADLGGAATGAAAAPLVWDAAGRARVTLLGGRDTAGAPLGPVWWH